MECIQAEGVKSGPFGRLLFFRYKHASGSGVCFSWLWPWASHVFTAFPSQPSETGQSFAGLGRWKSTQWSRHKQLINGHNKCCCQLSPPWFFRGFIVICCSSHTAWLYMSYLLQCFSVVKLTPSCSLPIGYWCDNLSVIFFLAHSISWVLSRFIEKNNCQNNNEHMKIIYSMWKS